MRGLGNVPAHDAYFITRSDISFKDEMFASMKLLHLGLAPSERIATPWLLHTSKAPCARYLQMYYQTPHGFIIGPCFATFLMFHFSNAM